MKIEYYYGEMTTTNAYVSIPSDHPITVEYEKEEEFVYCENCGCIIPDEHLEKVGNCNHCGAPPPKGLKHAR